MKPLDDVAIEGLVKDFRLDLGDNGEFLDADGCTIITGDRGLVTSADDLDVFTYSPTTALLSHLSSIPIDGKPKAGTDKVFILARDRQSAFHLVDMWHSRQALPGWHPWGARGRRLFAICQALPFDKPSNVLARIREARCVR